MVRMSGEIKRTARDMVRVVALNFRVRVKQF